VVASPKKEVKDAYVFSDLPEEQVEEIMATEVM